MDEPTSGLDPEAQRGLKQWLAAQRGTGAGVLLSSHSLKLVADCCTRLLIMHRGLVVAEGPLGRLAERHGLEPDDAEGVFFAAIGRPGATPAVGE